MSARVGSFYIIVQARKFLLGHQTFKHAAQALSRLSMLEERLTRQIFRAHICRRQTERDMTIDDECECECEDGDSQKNCMDGCGVSQRVCSVSIGRP